MLHFIALLLEIVAGGLALCSLAYYGMCLWCARQFLREQALSAEPGASTQSLPALSILKPVKGVGPETYDCLRSHCLQDYPEYEMIFGIHDPSDPAADVVRRLQSEYPQRPIRLVICRRDLGTNIKVSNLAQMLPEAIYDCLLVNDGDICVGPDYLRSVASPLRDNGVGLVTCLYRAMPASTLGSRLEWLGISTDFAPGVLVARHLEGMRFALGSTLAFRRRDLLAIGGFETILDHLADDYELGSRIASLGLEVRLSGNVVETFLPAYTPPEFWNHQLRWARTIRDVRRWGYLGLAFTFGFPWALLALLASAGAVWAWILLVAVMATRAAVALAVGREVLHDRHLGRSLWLLPLRDCVGLLVWIVSFAGHRVVWHGHDFRLKNGKLVRV